MSWYYASAEAKPVGPVTEQELHALHADGTILPETYVIEYTGQPVENWAWQRYSEVFPPVPLPAAPAPPPPAIYASPPIPAPVHPLFPSAGPVSYVPPAAPALAPPVITPVLAPVQPHPPAGAPTNGWCGWGFALGIVGLLLSPACGLGVLLALPALLFCVIGLVQVMRNQGQSGRGLAIAGLVMSGIALLVAIVVLASFLPTLRTHYEWTVTEQTTNDSD